MLTNVIYIKSLLSSLNDASVYIVDDEGSFEFSHKAEFASLLHSHITLTTNTDTESPHFTQQLQC